MSDDCDLVNGVPIRTFWAQVAGNPAAARRLRSNYQTCKGLLDDPLLTKLAKVEDIKRSMDAPRWTRSTHCEGPATLGTGRQVRAAAT